jgi:hypothetical protein
VHSSPTNLIAHGDVLVEVNGVNVSRAALPDVVSLISTTTLPCVLLFRTQPILFLDLEQLILDPRRLLFVNNYFMTHSADVVKQAIDHLRLVLMDNMLAPFMNATLKMQATEARATLLAQNPHSFLSLLSVDVSARGFEDALRAYVSRHIDRFKASPEYKIMCAATASCFSIDLSSPLEELVKSLPFLLFQPPHLFSKLRLAGLATHSPAHAALLLKSDPSNDKFRHLEVGPALVSALHLEVLRASWIPFAISSPSSPSPHLDARFTMHKRHFDAVYQPLTTSRVTSGTSELIITRFTFAPTSCGTSCVTSSFEGAVLNEARNSTPLPASFPEFIKPQISSNADPIVTLVIPDVNLPGGFWYGASFYFPSESNPTAIEVLTVLSTKDRSSEIRKILRTTPIDDSGSAIESAIESALSSTSSSNHSPSNHPSSKLPFDCSALALMSVRSISLLVTATLFEQKLFIVGDRTAVTSLVLMLAGLIAPIRYPHLLLPFAPQKFLTDGLATIPTPAIIGIEAGSFVPHPDDNAIIYYSERDVVIGGESTAALGLSMDISLAVALAKEAGTSIEEAAKSSISLYINTLLSDLSAATFPYTPSENIFDESTFLALRALRDKREHDVPSAQGLSQFIAAVKH